MQEKVSLLLCDRRGAAPLWFYLTRYHELPSVPRDYDIRIAEITMDKAYSIKFCSLADMSSIRDRETLDVVEWPDVGRLYDKLEK